MRGWILAAVLMTGPGWAGDARLDAAEITAALTGKSVVYDDGTGRVFKVDGQTVFDNGRPSLGQWAVRGDQYCSVWPPSDRGACLDVMTRAGGAVGFVVGDGSVTAGHIAP